MNFHLTFSPVLASDGGDVADAVLRMVVGLPVALLTISLFFGSFYLLHFLLTLPMQRAERARLFLDLLEDALRRGQSGESMVLSLAQNRERILGVRFYLVAAYIENGSRLGDALTRVPPFLPPQIVEMLRAGEALGDLKKVLPACREILRDRPQGVRSAMHYMLLMVLIFSPAFVAVTTLSTIFIEPKFKEVCAGMNIRLPLLTVYVFRLTESYVLVGIEVVLSLLLLAMAGFYFGGPPMARRIPGADRCAWRIPWKRKRLVRTFSAMLAVLLDGGVPEAEAVRLAGECTANKICRQRAGRVTAALQQGVKLEEAVRLFDAGGDFRWRLANAARVRGSFLQALRGWHEALEAKAFQQEEAAAHGLTSGLVILNGVLVALIAMATFGVIIELLKAMVFNT